MSLEAEAMKHSPASSGPRAAERPPRTFDRFVRSVATLLLVVILTAVFWIPMELMGGYIAAAFVLAILTILGAGIASRLYHLRVRVQALEAVLDDQDRRPAAPPPVGTGETPQASRPRSEEIKH